MSTAWRYENKVQSFYEWKKIFLHIHLLFSQFSRAYNICHWLHSGDTQNLGWCEGWYSYFLRREGSGIYYRILMKVMLIEQFFNCASFLVFPIHVSIPPTVKLVGRQNIFSSYNIIFISWCSYSKLLRCLMNT